MSNIETMTLDEAIKKVPAIGQTQHKRMSEKYQIIQTKDVLEGFLAEGFQIQKAGGAHINSAKDPFGRHSVTLIHPKLKFKGSGDYFTVNIDNSYNGQCAFRIVLGIHRLVCENGLRAMVADTSATMRHIGDDVQDLVKDVLFQMKTKIRMIKETVEF